MFSETRLWSLREVWSYHRNTLSHDQDQRAKTCSKSNHLHLWEQTIVACHRSKGSQTYSESKVAWTSFSRNCSTHWQEVHYELGVLEQRRHCLAHGCHVPKNKRWRNRQQSLALRQVLGCEWQDASHRRVYRPCQARQILLMLQTCLRWEQLIWW